MKLFIERNIYPVINSYSQLYFSNNKVLGLLCIVASFLNPSIGLFGLIAVVASIIFARIYSFSEVLVHDGSYSFNCLLVGLYVGATYVFSLKLFFVMLVATLICLVLTIAISGWLYKYKLPYFSLPFIITATLTTSVCKVTPGLEFNTFDIFIYNHISSISGETGIRLFEKIEVNNLFPHDIEIFFKSIGSVIFQSSITSGILISIGILIFSRIAFTVVLLGFFVSYHSYELFFGSTYFIDNSISAANFIMIAMGLGAFYFVPNLYSYILVIIASVIAPFVLVGINQVFATMGLFDYSLSFCLVTMGAIYVLHFREKQSQLIFVPFIQYSPEKTVYAHKSNLSRYKIDYYFPIFLPFIGKWKVSQGYAGSITHKEDWQNALDFVIEDEEKKTYRYPGTTVENFYCYNLPVIAPMYGVVENIIDGIDDNEIGNVNLKNNWGNSILIKHTELLYSQISHIKKDSFKIKIGDVVNTGDILASIGNSGRSPEPHIHFQLQSLPIIGAKTLSYPITRYISYHDEIAEVKTNQIPQEGELISNVNATPILSNAFNFSLNKIIHVKSKIGNLNVMIDWKVCVDAYNYTYLYCEKTKSSAYFSNDGINFRFTKFYGDKKSALFIFYKSCYNVVLSYHQHLVIEDEFELDLMQDFDINFIQDFLAPFYVFKNYKYKLKYVHCDDDTLTNYVKLITKNINKKMFSTKLDTKFIIEIDSKGLRKIVSDDNQFHLDFIA